MRNGIIYRCDDESHLFLFAFFLLRDEIDFLKLQAYNAEIGFGKRPSPSEAEISEGVHIMKENQREGLNVSALSFLTAIAVIFVLMIAAYILTMVFPMCSIRRIPRCSSASDW